MKISVVGLGYVGLPLAVELAKHFEVVGFDINPLRVSALKRGDDATGEVSSEELENSRLVLSSVKADINDSTIYIITVPTPINQAKQPDLSPLRSASTMIGAVLAKGDIVIYESTVYPGCTEEFCVPILEENSSLTYLRDFNCGYSPERMNPGDKERTVKDIVKVTSGSCDQTAIIVDDIYSKIVRAGTHKASSIKVAEAAKVIENTQRDLNIAFVNELSIIFDRLDIDTSEVLEAAGTKWNFLPFKPGLVGGHCIGVDPFYLTYKAEMVGYHPEVILAGRRINDHMPRYVAQQIIKKLVQKLDAIKSRKVLVLGVTFKENCPDSRNTKVIDLVDELESFGIEVDCYDPHVVKDEFEHEYKRELLKQDTLPDLTEYSAVVVAVAHNEFKDLHFDDDLIIADLKNIFPKEKTHYRL